VQQLPNHATGVRTAVHLYPPTCVQGGGGDVSALCTVCLLILSRGQAGEAPPRNTAEGGLDSRGVSGFPVPSRGCHLPTRDGKIANLYSVTSNN
jgi:hypothetical protein